MDVPTMATAEQIKALIRSFLAMVRQILHYSITDSAHEALQGHAALAHTFVT